MKIKSTNDDFERLLAEGLVPATPQLTGFLESLGLPYESVEERVRLKESVEPLQPRQLAVEIGDETTGFNLEIHRTMTSTNDYVMERLNAPGTSTHVCLAEMQTKGKGRRGRNWVSPFGRNIYLSIGQYTKLPLTSLGGLSLVTGMQVVKSLRSFGLKEVGLKWPNDVIMGQGKLAGILVELKPAEKRGIGVVVGVGVNLSLTTEDTESIDQPFAQISSQMDVPRNRLAGRLVDGLLAAFSQFSREGFGVFAKDWERYNVYADKEVVVLRGEEKTFGIDRGVDSEGNLLLETTTGTEVFNSGEVSVRATDNG